MTINISSREKWPGNILSNFANTPFLIDGVDCASAEGFVQALKFSDSGRQKQVCTLVGKEAKLAGQEAAERIMSQKKIWWQGKEYIFRSYEHMHLIERALRAKFTQNDVAKHALLSTGEQLLTHNLGHPESPNTSLPAAEFIRILYQIRKELKAPK